MAGTRGVDASAAAACPCYLKILYIHTYTYKHIYLYYDFIVIIVGIYSSSWSSAGSESSMQHVCRTLPDYAVVDELLDFVVHSMIGLRISRVHVSDILNHCIAEITDTVPNKIYWNEIETQYKWNEHWMFLKSVHGDFVNIFSCSECTNVRSPMIIRLKTDNIFDERRHGGFHGYAMRIADCLRAF